MKTLQWKFYQNSYIFIDEKVFKNVVYKMAGILSRGGCELIKLLLKLWHGLQITSHFLTGCDYFSMP